MLPTTFRSSLDAFPNSERSDTVRAADAMTLTKYPDRAHILRADSDPGQAAARGYDRPEGYEYLARTTGSTLSPINGRRRPHLLAPDLRSAHMPHLLLDDPDPHNRHRTMVALALLGDAEVCEFARAPVLNEETEPVDRIVALKVLLVRQEFDPALLPPGLKKPAGTSGSRQEVMAVIRPRRGPFPYQG